MQESELKNWLYSELFERLPSNVAVLDREFRVVLANTKFAAEFGDWEGKRCHEVYRGYQSPCPGCQAELTFADGQSRTSEERRLNRRGTYSHYVTQFEPIVDKNGDVPYVIKMAHDVTQSRLVEQQYDVIFDRVPCYVTVIDQDLNIVRNNETFRKTFGESAGKKCYEVYQHRDEPCEECPAMRTFADSQSNVAHKVGKDKNGNKVHYHVTTTPLSRVADPDGAEGTGGVQQLIGAHNGPTHVIEMAVDFTQTRILEQQLKKSFDFQESLISNAIDGIVAVDSEGKITIFNPSAEKLFKLDAAEVMGRKIFDRFVPIEFINAIAEGDDQLLLPDTTVRDGEDEPVPVRFSGTVLNSGNEYIGSAAIFQDQHEIKQLEAEKLVAERLAAVGQTVAGLAHGIKNVLMGLEGGLYVMNSGMQKDDKELALKGWDMLQNNIERITTYVKDFLNFAKGRAPQVDMMDPGAVAKEVVQLYKDKADQTDVSLVSEIQENMAPACMDREGIHNCLTNLVSNAIDACEMSDNTGCSVRLRASEHGDAIVYEVQDQGCGMDYEVKKKVFTTFFSTKGTQKGTGLGLLITRRITQEHGGTITLDSIEGEGSIFRLEFPRSRLPKLKPSNETTE